jgi:Mn-dependent DtxR family transcriptional regulator
MEQTVKATKVRWSEEEKFFLKQNAGTMRDVDIADKLNKTIKAVREMRRRLGIIKKSGRGIVALRD